LEEVDVQTATLLEKLGQPQQGEFSAADNHTRIFGLGDLMPESRSCKPHWLDVTAQRKMRMEWRRLQVKIVMIQ
jgi:hypothetical protein